MIKNVILKFFTVLSVIFVMTTGANANSEQCLRALATDLATNIEENIDPTSDIVAISSDGLVEFFTKNIDICRDYLLARISPDEDIALADPDLTIDVDWDYLTEEVAAALTTTGNYRQLFVCENHRSLQAGIDAALWATTIVSAVFSFGTAGVTVQAGKTALVQGVKNLTKIGVKKGAKTAAVQATAKKLGYDIADKAAAKAAKVAAKKAVDNNAVVISIKATNKRLKNPGIKKAIQTGVANGTIPGPDGTAALNLIDDLIAKEAAYATIINAEKAATQALKTALTRFAISTPATIGAGWLGIYSFLESELNTQVMNCTNTDRGEGCYVSCTKDSLTAPTDDLNTKVFKPIFGKNLCVDEENNYVLREISASGIPMADKVFMTTNEKWTTAKTKIEQSVKDQGNCDWNEDDIDIYVGAPLYDPSTLMPTGNGATGLLIDGMRIDD